MPRKINAGELAEKMGLHKTTLLEHIHKAKETSDRAYS
jgi:predicted DNA binding protein